jgi:hypothetical protein
MKPSLFVTPKSPRAIPAADQMRRDFLIQSSLDAGVRRIEYHPAMRVGDRIVPVGAFILDSDSGRHAVDFVDARLAHDPIGEYLMELAFNEGCTGLMYVTGDDIRREPRFSVSRDVWRHHKVDVHTADRAEIVGALEMEGPLQLRALAGLVDTRRDMREVVCALACAGDVEIDLHESLGARTMVRLGMRTSLTCERFAYGA